ncbi:MAG: GIY-YIG nuclease family protein [Reyranella sp.]|uniref:GIY-YIG nuclease family protein n=1 Tax=Reyranella sp. TaxID=1929291 RepID=UPI003D13CD3E
MPVYFARQGVTGNVKIGFTADVTKRMPQLQSGQLIPLLLMRLLAGSAVDEKALHRRFADHAIGGEWFRFHPDMSGALGMADLPMPRIGRYGKHNWPDTALGYRRALHHEIIEIIGGPLEFARRCHARPWLISEWAIHKEHWSAALILLAEKGRADITRAMLEAAEAAAYEEHQKQEEDAARRKTLRVEAEWIRRHPGIPPWWSVSPENRALLPETLLRIVSSNDLTIPPTPSAAKPERAA